MHYLYVAGSRRWSAAHVVQHALDCALIQWKRRLMVVHGACPDSPDTIADKWAAQYEVPCLSWPARWKTGTASSKAKEGSQRNERMAGWLWDMQRGWSGIGRPSGELAAFWDGYSTGTLNMVTKAHGYGFEINVYDPSGNNITESTLARVRQFTESANGV